jgi:hypothetical protein
MLTATCGTVTGIDVTISSAPGASGTLKLSDSDNGSLLRINANQTVTLQDVSLEGRGTGGTDNNAPLVLVNGEFIMENGSSISGNTGSSASGGSGVGVSGIVTMNGGEIHDNKSTSAGGGGVLVMIGTFTMNSGAIYDNTAQTGGGGVFVIGGTFTMNSGAIYGNTAQTGGGVCIIGLIDSPLFNLNFPATKDSIYGNSAISSPEQVFIDDNGVYGVQFFIDGVLQSGGY